MSGGKGGGSSSSGTSYSTNQYQNFIPSWVESGSQNLLAQAEQLVATPLQAYQQIRDLQGTTDPYFQASLNQYSSLLGNLQSLTPDQQNALTNALYSNYGQQVISPAQAYLSQAYGNAQDLYGQALGYSQGQYGGALANAANYYGQALGGAGGLLGSYTANAGPATAREVAGNVNTLMNPYIQQVAAPTEQIYNQMIGQQMLQNSGQAANVGAFGGSRMGVQNAVAQAQGSLGASQYLSNLLSQGYNAALQPAYGLATGRAQEGLQAGQYLSGLGMQAAQNLGQFGMQAAGALGQQAYGSAQGLGSFGSNAANALVSLLQGGYG